MREVLISIQPKWCELIASGKKTVEIRKTKPKIDTPFKCYIYCTLSGSNEFFKEDCNSDIAEWNKSKMALKKGKVIGEFVCDKITMSLVGYNEDFPSYWDILSGSCLSPAELLCYGKWKPLYGWHISDLVIYDKPKELSEFHKAGYTETKESVSWLTREEENSWQIKRPPQSWCYVELLKGGAE